MWFYVNRLGGERIAVIAEIKSGHPSARFLYLSGDGIEDPASEIPEIRHSVANPFQNFYFAVAALYEAIGPRCVHRIEYLVEPVVI